eukprot:GHRQ01007140.1.p2 GENE.GHRQ01007140.1~~GHRQ01007140.1.p2  ORF type:complete len:181 (+),score=104.47 GHRQ01007140.1:987-1529(+)
MTKSLMPGLVYGCGCLVGTECFKPAVALNMGLIAVGVLVCALGEVNLVLLGLLEQLTALGFEAMRLTLVQVLMNSSDKLYNSKFKPEGGLAYLGHQPADLEQPLLQNRNKEDILAEIQQLQAEMEAIDRRGGRHGKLPALGSNTVSRLHSSSGGSSSNSGGSSSSSPCLSLSSSKLEHRS